MTADRAWLARKHVPGVKVYGGITLNGAVGGVNPQAVEWMWRMQGGHGRVVWFPTFDADNHVRRAGTAPAGIRVVDEAGAVLPEVREVLEVCARERLVVQTGHSSAEQALAIITAAREEGCDRIVVRHAQFDVVGMTETQMKQAASLGAKMELCALMTLVGPDAHLEWMRHSTRIPLADTAARVRAVGAQHFVLGTDLGQTGNPTPADGLQMFVTGPPGGGHHARADPDDGPRSAGRAPHRLAQVTGPSHPRSVRLSTAGSACDSPRPSAARRTNSDSRPRAGRPTRSRRTRPRRPGRGRGSGAPRPRAVSRGTAAAPS